MPIFVIQIQYSGHLRNDNVALALCLQQPIQIFPLEAPQDFKLTQNSTELIPTRKSVPPLPLKG